MKKVILFSLLFWTVIIYIACTRGNAQSNNNINIAVKNTNEKTVEIKDSPFTTATLIAANAVNTGSVKVTNDAYFIYVTYQTQNGYVLAQTHLYIGVNYLIPLTKAGNIMTEKFPYSTIHNNEASYTYQIPILAIPSGTCGSIAAQASVVKYNAAGKITDQQTVWANSAAANNTNTAEMKFDYCCTAQ